MSLNRLPALPPQPPQPAQPVHDVSAAQRAFFQAAAAPAPAVAAPPVKPQTIDPDRPLRPGSLLDIRV